MKTKKTLVLILALILIVSLFAGCGSDQTNVGTENPATDTQGTTEPVNDGSVQAATTEGKENSALGADDNVANSTSVLRDEVNVAIASDLGTWDPFNLTTLEGRQGVYQSLGYIIDDVYLPCLMKEYSFNEDMTVIYGEIFDNIYDSKGNHMTAADIVWSYDMANAGTTAGLGSICEGCYQTGEYTFEFHLFDTMQTGRMDKILKWYAVCRESYEASPDHMATDPVGTGPYKVTNITSGYSYTLERRDDYWQTDDTLRSFRDAANAERINFYIISESAQRAIALENGSVDVVTSLSSEELEIFRNSEDFWLYAIPSDKSMDFMPNCDPNCIMSDINLRLACYYAIDASAVAEGAYGKGGAYVNHCIAPDWSTGYDPEWATLDNYYNSYDPELAMEYLKKSNYNNETIRLMCMSDAASSAATQIVQGFLGAIGIDASIVSLERSVFQDYMKKADEWDVVITGNACNTYWVDACYGNLSTDRTDWGSSQTFVWDDELESLLRYTISMKNASQENYEILNDYIMENAYWYSMCNNVTFIVVPKWCQSVALNNAKGLYAGGCCYIEE